MDERIEKVKARIRKLFAMAADDVSLDGEIVAAMKLAEAAMNAYHLSRADVEASAEQSSEAAPVETFDRRATSSKGVRLSPWESTLLSAIHKLVGTTQAYVEGRRASFDGFTSVRHTLLQWYGPTEDVEIAVSIFEEWQSVISTLAYGRYKSCLKGTGLQFSRGFARGLYDQAMKVHDARHTIVTAATTAIVKHGEGTLAAVLAGKQKRSVQWLATTHQVRLVAGRRSRATITDHDAYDAGRTMGQSMDVSVVRSKKIGPSPRLLG